MQFFINLTKPAIFSIVSINNNVFVLIVQTETGFETRQCLWFVDCHPAKSAMAQLYW